MSRYEGVCYDGPWEGKSYVSPYSYFRVALHHPLNVYIPGPDELIPPSVSIGHYIWSRPLRKWVYAGQ